MSVILALILNSILVQAAELRPAPNSPSLSAVQCLYRLADELNARNAKLNHDYRELDPRSGSISKNKAAAVLLPATYFHEDEGVLLVHGFAASPGEVESVGDSISGAGYPVVMPLLPGFGSTTLVANSYTKADWERAIDQSLDLMSLCFRKVHLVGFSIGGGLVSRYILLHPKANKEAIEAAHGPVNIESVTLLSPYYQTGNGMADWIAQRLNRSFGIQGVPIETTYNALQWLNLQSQSNDLKALVAFSSNFNVELPLKAAEQVQLFGEELRNIPANVVTNIPVYLAYSEVDKTVSTKTALKFVETHFSTFARSRDLMAIGAVLKVPHQIAVPSWNPMLPTLLLKINAHLNEASGF